mmetsp:Transcript_93456/g.185427  ORF Transcript_93456/g.185427 Transcript_93456/m.185427 type:complete len:293 (-) Transcript_93456:518-1396(-)
MLLACGQSPLAIVLLLIGGVPLLACNLLEIADVADCSVRCSSCCKAGTLGLILKLSRLRCRELGVVAFPEEESASLSCIEPSGVDVEASCVEAAALLREPLRPPRLGTSLASDVETARSLPSSALMLSSPIDEPGGVPSVEELFVETLFVVAATRSQSCFRRSVSLLFSSFSLSQTSFSGSADAVEAMVLPDGLMPVPDKERVVELKSILAPVLGGFVAAAFETGVAWSLVAPVQTVEPISVRPASTCLASPFKASSKRPAWSSRIPVSPESPMSIRLTTCADASSSFPWSK